MCALSKQKCSLVHHASFCCTYEYYEYNAIIFHTFILDVVSCVVIVVVVVVAGYMALPNINL